MNFLVIGLGSMGRRRVRCLQLLGFEDIFGFDIREDRRAAAHEKYGIKTFSDIDNALAETRPTALIISVPPDIHHKYMKLSIRNGIHFFVEASVVDTDMELVKEQLAKTPVVAAPSATMLFHPAIKKISAALKSNALGKISNILFHTGQYLPDWHTYEKVSEYYVSNPATGGAREIVPFELTWIVDVFGFPGRVCGNVRKTIDIKGAEEIDDTYNCLMDYGDFLMSMTIDVVSRYATRRLLVNGDRGQLVWDWNKSCIDIFNAEKGAWSEIPYDMSGAEDGYNPNIGENMYVEELRCFIEALTNKRTFRNTLGDDIRVLRLLYAIEESDKTASFVSVK